MCPPRSARRYYVGCLRVSPFSEVSDIRPPEARQLLLNEALDRTRIRAAEAQIDLEEATDALLGRESTAGLEEVEAAAVASPPRLTAVNRLSKPAGAIPDLAISDLLLERGGLRVSPASTDREMIGVVAGPQALAYGYAFQKLTPAVAYVVETAREGELLKNVLGVSSGEIFVVGEYGGIAEAAKVAEDSLRGVWQATRVERLGVDKPVSQTIQLLLLNLFGIRLNPTDEAPWSAFMGRINEALERASSA